jgi:succinate dehydrogenase/fumarate reductase cytochrome b subunit
VTKPPAERRGAGGPAGGVSPLGRVASALTLVWVVWYAVDLIVLGMDPSLFNRVHRLLGGFGPRAAFAVLAGAVAFHATDGLRRASVDLVPALRRWDGALAAGARFVTMAVWVPGALVIMWPALVAWWAR